MSLADGERVWMIRTTDPTGLVEDLESAFDPGWVWWSSRGDGASLVAAGVRLAACWDLAAVHRLIRGGWCDDPAQVWALAAGRPEEHIPSSGQLDLLQPASTDRSAEIPTDAADCHRARSARPAADDPNDPRGSGRLPAPRLLAAGLALATPARAGWAELAMWVSGASSTCSSVGARRGPADHRPLGVGGGTLECRAGSDRPAVGRDRGRAGDR